MRGTIERNHHLEDSAQCEKCGAAVSVVPTMDWRAVLGTGARGDGTIESGLGSARAVVAQMYGVDYSVVHINDVIMEDSYRTLSVLPTIGNTPVADVKIEFTKRFENTPGICTYEADVCEHGSEVGGWCYQCPDRKAAPVEENEPTVAKE